MIGRPKANLELSEVQRQELERMVRAGTGLACRRPRSSQQNTQSMGSSHESCHFLKVFKRQYTSVRFCSNDSGTPDHARTGDPRLGPLRIVVRSPVTPGCGDMSKVVYRDWRILVETID